LGPPPLRRNRIVRYRNDGRDADFVRAFEDDAIAPADFHHRDHLRLAWAYLERCESADEAAARIAAAVKRFAASIGKADKYHDTITVFWMRVTAAARGALPAGSGFDDLLNRDPRLLDKDMLFDYYSRERLFSEAARGQWVAPDLRPLD